MDVKGGEVVGYAGRRQQAGSAEPPSRLAGEC